MHSSNSAGAERLFPARDFIHSNRRNKLLLKTVLKLARICSSLLEEAGEKCTKKSVDEAVAYVNKSSLSSIADDETDDDETSEHADNSEQRENSDHDPDIFEPQLQSGLIRQQGKEEDDKTMELEVEEEIEIIREYIGSTGVTRSALRGWQYSV